MSLKELQAMVRAAGFTNCSADWENDAHVYAFSLEAVPGTFGHPKFTAHYGKYTGYLSVTGKPAVKVHDYVMGEIL